MNPTTLNQIAIGALIGIAGFFARLWFKGRADSEGSLASGVAALASAIKDLAAEVRENREVQVRHDTELAEHRRELDGIWRGENCMNTNCPMRPK